MSGCRCGCCDPLVPPTPALVENRPLLSAIAYRVGTYSTFRQAMVQRIAGAPDLAGLRTRQSDDYAITLIEMWATIADILSFYDERFANEGYLRTAGSRDSLLRLARLVDYQLRPGSAATTMLAFTLEKDARVVIPAGLRVQSVPADGEKPQKFETTASFTGDGRMNRLSVVPGPIPINPLRQGALAAYLAPGKGSLAFTALKPDDRILLVGGSHVEEMVVGRVTPANDLLRLDWKSPIFGSLWSLNTRASRLAAILRLFGRTAPGTYMAPSGTTSVTWTLTPVVFDYPSASVESLGNLVLDSRVEGITAGTRLVVTWTGGLAEVVVTGVDQVVDTLGPVSETVTRLTISPSLPGIVDRRNVLIYQLAGAPLEFWGYDYPARLVTPRVFIPGERTDWSAITVCRTIAAGRYQDGIALDRTQIERSRKVLLLDDKGTPEPAVITRAVVVGNQISLEPTATDRATAAELGFVSDQAQAMTALASPELNPFPPITNSPPELLVRIGTAGERRVILGTTPTTLTAAASELQQSIRAADPAPEFAKVRVFSSGNRLLMVPGIPGAKISISPTPSDLTTAILLGLESTLAELVDGWLSASLMPFPPVTAIAPQLAVTIGLDGPYTASLGARPTTLSTAASEVQSAIRGIGSERFLTAIAAAMGDRLLVLPGLSNGDVQDYLALDLEPETAIDLAADSAVLLGNVTTASHGETIKSEVLGDGDASAAFQRFSLKKKPLTYLPGASSTGLDSTLRVLVGGSLWKEVPTLFGQGSRDQVFVTRMADDNSTSVQFGDGRAGARLPSGRGSVVASYRQGSGLEGRVGAAALSNLLDRPVGVKAVSNPLGAEGGASPERLEEARQNVPTTVRTFGRAISLRDFEDLTRASGEVAKARATWIWKREERAVHLTVAAQGGALFTKAALTRIHGAITARRDPNHLLLLGNFIRVPIVVEATLMVEETRVASTVLEDARSALLAALSFDRLGFGQPIHLSDVYYILQQVTGVASVDIDLLQFKNRSAAYLSSRGADADPVQQHLRIYPARPSASVPGDVVPAEQAWIEVPSQDVTLLSRGGLQP